MPLEILHEHWLEATHIESAIISCHAGQYATAGEGYSLVGEGYASATSGVVRTVSAPTTPLLKWPFTLEVFYGTVWLEDVLYGRVAVSQEIGAVEEVSEEAEELSLFVGWLAQRLDKISNSLEAVHNRNVVAQEKIGNLLKASGLDDEQSS